MQDMQYTEIVNAIFSAIDIIVDKKLEKLKFDRCIVAQVVSYDTESQIYTCDYQSNKFRAKAIAGLSNLSSEQWVYVLIPRNDWSYDKFILAKKGEI